MRRFLGIFGVAAIMVSTLAGPVLAVTPSGLTPTGQGLQGNNLINVSKTASGRLAQSDPDLLARTDSKLIPILVKMDVDPVASYRGGVTRLQPTSPEFDGPHAEGERVSRQRIHELPEWPGSQRSARGQAHGPGDQAPKQLLDCLRRVLRSRAGQQGQGSAQGPRRCRGPVRQRQSPADQSTRRSSSARRRSGPAWVARARPVRASSWASSTRASGLSIPCLPIRASPFPARRPIRLRVRPVG